MAPESRLAAAGPLEKRLGSLTPRRSSRVRVWCSSPSTSPASPFPSQRVTVNDAQKVAPGAEQKQRIGSAARPSKTTTRVASISSPAVPMFPNDGHDGYFKTSQNGAPTSRSPKIEVSAKGKWQKQHDSSLSEDEPLPLPMTWPDSVPASKEKVAELLKCDPEIKVREFELFFFLGGEGIVFSRYHPSSDGCSK